MEHQFLSFHQANDVAIEVTVHASTEDDSHGEVKHLKDADNNSDDKTTEYLTQSGIMESTVLFIIT